MYDGKEKLNLWLYFLSTGVFRVECFSVSIINPCFLRFITVLKSGVVLNHNRKCVILHLQCSCNCTLRSVIFSVYPQCFNKVHWSYIYWEKNNISCLELVLSLHRAECITRGQRASTCTRLTKIPCYALKILTCIHGGPSELQLTITSLCPWAVWSRPSWSVMHLGSCWHF